MTGNVLLGFGSYELWPAESDSLTAVFLTFRDAEITPKQEKNFSEDLLPF